MFANLYVELSTIVMLIAISIAFRAALVRIGQTWVTSFAHTATLTTLPIITFVITKVISGNIALSLGMIGALSIVRFRNPVKSPFELSVYFGAITMGISASVAPFWLALFVCSMAIALLALAGMSFFGPRFSGRPYFQASFSEGNRMSTLEIEANDAIEALNSNPNLISVSQREGAHTYILASDKFADLQEDLRGLNGNPSVIETRLNK